MNTKQREWLETFLETDSLTEHYPAFVAWFDEQLNLEAGACAQLAEAQARDLNEIPDAHGGSWAKKFGMTVALAIVEVIRQRKHARP